MNIEPSLIEAEVYFSDPLKDRYFIKISFLGTGMYINSFSVQPSKFEDSPYWLQPPKHRQGMRWIPTVDFAKGYPLWQIIEEKAIKAVEQYKLDIPSPNSKDVVLEDIDDKPINFDNLSF